jgi:membrane protein DedA with SNARE-associated domain
MKSFLFITLGVCLAGVVVTMLTLLRLYGLIIALLILSSFAVVYVLRIRRRMRRDRAAVEHPVRTPGEEPHER